MNTYDKCQIKIRKMRHALTASTVGKSEEMVKINSGCGNMAQLPVALSKEEVSKLLSV
ncbi:hypothetical protein CLV51_10756 [Chitinophaga niastensis]|uniref:Uncharacterized protein n=1 Tax=Chitinophaga niastensis TaxID=536980 RepID=A0A2P8HC01_CHINA|nr:hypothetical protein CLV51_10756 [Chitinophaga niastensis]